MSYHMSCTCKSKSIQWMENFCKTIVMTIWPQFQFENIFNVFVFEMKELLEISVKSTNFIDKTAQTHEMTYLFFFSFRFQSLNLTHVPEHSHQIYEFRWIDLAVDDLSNLLPLLLLQVIYIYFLWSDHFYSIRQVLHTTTNPSLMMKFIIETLIDSIIVFFLSNQIEH